MRFDPDCSPEPNNGGPAVTKLAVEITRACCLRCDYCYMADHNAVTMAPETAEATVDWLLRNSGSQERVKIHFFGGEPLMAPDLMEQLVAYGKRQAKEAGKQMTFGMTTNLVLADKDRVAWAKRLGMTFHTSIDGAPAAHDKHRVFPNGTGSCQIVAENARHVLAEYPNITARATVSPDTAPHLYESVLFLAEVGYKNMAFIPVPELDWSDDDLATYDAEMAKVTEYYLDRYRRGERWSFHALTKGIKSIANPKPIEHHCGAGRNYLGVDVHGTVWPCHRFSGYNVPAEEIALATVFDDGISRKEAHRQFVEFRRVDDMKADCKSCPAVHACGSMCVAVSYDQFRELGRTSGRYCELRRLEFKHATWAHYVLRREGCRAFMSEFYPAARRTAGQPARLSVGGPRTPCPVGYSGHE